MKKLCDRVEFSLGHLNMATLLGALTENLIGTAVQYAGDSGNIVFVLPIPTPEHFLQFIQVYFRPFPGVLMIPFGIRSAPFHQV